VPLGVATAPADLLVRLAEKPPQSSHTAQNDLEYFDSNGSITW
jgi:hypothetical protein